MDGDIRTPEVKVEAVLDQPPGPPFPGMQFSVGPDHGAHQYAAPPHHGAQYLGMGRTEPAPQYSGHPHPGIHLPPRPDLGSPYTSALDSGPQYLGRPDLAIAYSTPPQPVPTYMSQPHPGIPLPIRPDAGMLYSGMPSRPETIDPFEDRPSLVEPGVSEMAADGPSGIQDSLADATAPEADTGPPQGDLGGDTDVAMTTNDEDSAASNSESPESEPEPDEPKADDEGPRPFPCDECAVTFVDRLQLAIHERMHADQQPLPCRECGRVFFSSLALLRHERVHMPRPTTDAAVEGGRRRRFGSHAPITERSVKCGVCEEEFEECEMREEHLGYWWCAQCQHVFGLRCQLSRHGCSCPDIKEEQDPDSPAPTSLMKNKRKPGRPRKLKPEEAGPIENKRKKREESKKAHLSQEEEGEEEPPAIPAQLETSMDEDPPEPKTRRPRKSAVPKQYLSSDPEDTEHESEESDPEWTGEMEYVECSDEDETPATPSSKSVKCEICDKTFRSHNNLSRHLIRHISHKIADHAFKEGKRKSKFEKDDNESSAAASDMPTKFKCKMCGQGFHSRVTMQRHKQSEHGAPGIRYQCELCPMSYDRSDLITRHTMKEHGQERTHKCTKCKACFTQASLLECHMKLHERARTPYVPYRMRAKCNVCKMRFRSEELMSKHECSGPRARVICDVCGRSCATEAVLRRHQLLHVTHRPCGCDTCGARFVDKYALKAHLKTHLPDRPHVCHVCARGFKARGLLKRHMQFHTDERPFVCDHCGKAFKAANQLQNHIRIHTGEKPFPCTICSKPFRQAQQLKTHMKTHDPNKPHKTPKRQDEGWVQDLLMGSVRETHAPESAAIFRLAQPLPAQHAADATTAGGLAQGNINQRPIMGALSPQNSITTSTAGSIRSGM